MPVMGDQGLQNGWAVDNSGRTAFSKSVTDALPLMVEAGAGWVRINFRLGGCFHDWTSPGCNGQTAVDQYDAVVAAAEAEGLQVLGLLSNESWHSEQPGWVVGNAEHGQGNGDNDYARAFAERAAAPLVRRFAGRVAAWEVWNEPNAWSQSEGGGRYSGGTFMYPSNYAWLLRRVYEAVREQGSEVPLIAGGLFAHDTGGGDSGARHLHDTYGAGRRLAGWKDLRDRYGTYPLDGIAQHLYLDPGGNTSAAKVVAYVEKVRRTYVAIEGRDTPKRMHITEMGWRSDAVGEAVQARNLETAYEALGRLPYVARAYWTSIEDIGGGDLYGLVRADRSPKPAFAAFQTVATWSHEPELAPMGSR